MMDLEKDSLVRSSAMTFFSDEKGDQSESLPFSYYEKN